MSEDVKYLKNYKVDHLYSNSVEQGEYIKLVVEDETPIAEFELGPRTRLAISAFFAKRTSDVESFVLTKLKSSRATGWQIDSKISLSNFGLKKIQVFADLIRQLEIGAERPARINLSHIDTEIESLLANPKLNQMLAKLSNSNELTTDIFALEHKRSALAEFRSIMDQNLSESVWQNFFERNQWIFGIGLHFAPLEKVAKKLEAATTGNSFDQRGKRADGLLKTKAEISQFVVAEIKTPQTELLKNSSPYRADCWAISPEVAGAVAQCQMTSFLFSKNRFEVVFKDDDGNKLDETAYAIQPKTYLIVGNLDELKKNDSKITSFELFRKNVLSPEIVTFDELCCRAEALVENIGSKDIQLQPEAIDPEEIPF